MLNGLRQSVLDAVLIHFRYMFWAFNYIVPLPRASDALGHKRPEDTCMIVRVFFTTSRGDLITSGAVQGPSRKLRLVASIFLTMAAKYVVDVLFVSLAEVRRQVIFIDRRWEYFGG